jgi:DNA-binding response OmpR family regulator
MWRILSYILEKYEMSVVPARSGEAALEWPSRNRADVIVSEYYLMEMSGLDFHRALRAERISSPFIFFSESDNPKVNNCGVLIEIIETNPVFKVKTY